MPQEFKPYINEMDDRRRKIPTSEYETIRAKYKALKSMRAVARLYNVDKRLIQFIVYPERKEAYQKMRYKQKIWLKYYDRESHTISIRKHRKRKRELGLVVVKSKKI